MKDKRGKESNGRTGEKEETAPSSGRPLSLTLLDIAAEARTHVYYMLARCVSWLSNCTLPLEEPLSLFTRCAMNACLQLFWTSRAFL